MTESTNQAVAPIELRKSVLDEIHVAASASMIEREGWSVPASYGDDLFEYAAVREAGAGLIDLSARGRFLVTGSEAVQFLNGLITNDMKTLAENSWMPAAFPNVQGRLIASVRVIRLNDDTSGKNPTPTFLVDTEAITHEPVLQTIKRFTLAGDFHVTDLTGETALLSVQGKQAAEITRSVLGEAAPATPEHGVTITPWQQESVTVLRAAQSAVDGFDLVVAAANAPRLWEALVAAGARPVGNNALEILRIEAGQPRYGIDMDETTVVTEANLDAAVSYTKGCYIGQEIIARIKYRGHVAKSLSGLVFSRSVRLASDAVIRSLDDKEIGRVTSFTLSPHLGCTLGLGYVKYDYIAPGTEVKVLSAGAEFSARVTELPFVTEVPASQ
ncbi:MAG: aminomethyltransferase family protein [Acidobacteriota bacterium]